MVGANLQIIVGLSGEQNVQRLAERIREVNNLLKETDALRQFAKDQTRGTISNLRLESELLKERANTSQLNISYMATEKNAIATYNKQLQDRISTEQLALQIRDNMAKHGVFLTLEESRTRATATKQFFVDAEARKTAWKQEIADAKAYRMQLMQASISLFVFNISMNQMITALKPLANGNKEVESAINAMSASMNLAIAPLQMFMAVEQLMIALNLTLAQTFMMVGSSMGAMFFWMMAITSKSKELKVVFGVIAGALTALAVKQVVTALSTIFHAGAIATLSAVLGDPTKLMMLAGGLALTGGAIGAGLGMMQGATAKASAMGAQTTYGQYREVRKSGIARLDMGEVVSRVSSARPMGGGSSGSNIYINVHPGAYVGESAMAQLGKVVKKAVSSGGGRTIIKRVST